MSVRHPWLPTGFLRVGEPVVTLNGGVSATVVAVRVVPGAAQMWDLTVAYLHDFAVGASQAVVHNCGNIGNADATGYKGDPNNVAGTVDGVTFYNGQAVDAKYTDPWENSGWTRVKGSPNNPDPGLNTSQAFAKFIRQRHPNEPVGDWIYTVERWRDPLRPNEIIENHYWQNWSRLGEYYHHH